MKDIYDYLKYYGNSSFKELAFNEVDSLIITLLTYAKLKDIVPSTKKGFKNLKSICEIYLNKYSEKDFKKEDYLFPSTYKLIKAIKDCQRFNEAKIYYYLEEINKETQFGALTFRLPNLCYVAFEGTDSNIVGWEEDFELIYKYPTISQTKAKNYLNETISLIDRCIYVGGHSKGGNLAMYAYMHANQSIKKRIKNIYNYDGPGFLEEIIKSNLYQEMLPKLKMYVPEQSIFGMMLGHQNFEVVKSHNLGLLQHYGDSWCCFGGKFLEGKISKKSQNLAINLKKYLDEMSLEEKVKFVETLTLICEHLGITNVMQFREIKPISIVNFFKEIKSIPNNMKKRFIEVIKLVISGS